jgi:hypothetical protein
LRTGKASTQLAEILPATYAGRVEALFVALEREQWGRFQPPLGPIVVEDETKLSGEPLLDLALFHIMRNKGVVFVLPAEEMPAPDGLVAIFYY